MKQRKAVVILSLCSVFLFFKYIAQLFPSLISQNLTESLGLSGVQLGVLASSYYYSYSFMQLASGVILDKYDVRLPAFFAVICIAASLIGFSKTDSFFLMCLYRALMGVGCAFATTLYMKSAACWTGRKVFGFISSLLATATMLGAAVGAAPIAILFDKFGWQQGLLLVGWVGIALGFLMLFNVKSKPQAGAKMTASFTDIKNVVFKRENQWLLLYSGLTFSPVVILGGLWGVPFLELKLAASQVSVAKLISVMFVGHAIGSPIWAILSNRFRKKELMIGANCMSFLCLTFLIYYPMGVVQAEILFFVFGFCVGCFMLSFILCRHINSLVVMGFAVAFINSGEGIVGSLLEPGIGYVLDLLKPVNSMHFRLIDFQYALSILPVSYIASTWVITKLPFEQEALVLESVERLA